MDIGTWLEKLFRMVDETIFRVFDMVDPSPKSLPKETIRKYVERLNKRHAMRFLKHEITKHLDMDVATEEYIVNIYHRKKDQKIALQLVKMIKDTQELEVWLYNKIKYQNDE